ncbi:MAG: hypothetical protein KatS3mg043_2213 [Rhodothermaceae bacterium]|nr:MAG: hypothetical protein KatS3mg043_2213 [Rhodothermaceae bacterium]
MWRVVVLSDGVYFQSTRQIMRWDGRPPMRVWRTATRFRPATAVRDTLFVSEDGRGLLALAGDTLALVPGGDVFADRPVYAVLPLPGGGLIVGTASDGLFRRSGGAFVPMPTGADDALRNGFLYTGVVLPGGPLAFGTIRRGGVVLAPDGRLLRRLDPSTGVPEDPILNLAVDREGALWVVQDGGLVRLETNNPMTVFDEALGIGGTVEAVARHRGRLYAATREGLRRLEPGPAGIPRFAPVPGFDGQIWDLVDAGETLLVASAGGVYALRDGRAENLLLAGHAYALYPDPDRPGRVWAGLGDGLAVLERRAGRWTAGRVAASDGAFDTRVQITWSNAGVDASQGLRIRRDGVEIDQVGAGATSYNDFDAAPGTLALYGVESVATGGTAGCDYGWTPPDGSISGRVASRLGGGIGDVAVCLAPNPNKALLFDGEGGTAVVQAVALPDSFTVELWVRPAALTGRQDLIALPNLRLGLTGAKLRLDYGTASGIESADLMTPAWQHVALTVHQNRTGPTSDVRLYRDGILVLSTSFNQVLDTGTHDWSFSGDTTNGDYLQRSPG